jgi:hypothetical protein
LFALQSSSIIDKEPILARTSAFIGSCRNSNCPLQSNTHIAISAVAQKSVNELNLPRSKAMPYDDEAFTDGTLPLWVGTA